MNDASKVTKCSRHGTETMPHHTETDPSTTVIPLSRNRPEDRPRAPDRSSNTGSACLAC
jgi:hypothetical protein